MSSPGFSDPKNVGSTSTRDSSQNSNNPKIKCAEKHNLPVISLQWLITCLFMGEIYDHQHQSSDWLQIYKQKVQPTYIKMSENIFEDLHNKTIYEKEKRQYEDADICTQVSPIKKMRAGVNRMDINRDYREQDQENLITQDTRVEEAPDKKLKRDLFNYNAGDFDC